MVKTKKNPRSKQPKLPLSAKIVLFIIVTAFVVLFFAIIFSILYSPKKQVEDRLSKIASSYYEDYIYSDIQSYNHTNDISKILEKYQDSGFTSVTLRQILLHDTTKNADDISFFEKYCDEDNTTIKIYPDPPFDQSSYHIEYTYTCDY